MKGILGKLIRQLILILLALVVVGAGVCWIMQQPQGLIAMLGAFVACTFSAVVCLVPVGFAIEKQASWLGQACLAATVIRFLLTLLSATIVYLILNPDKASFATWLVVDYFVLLIWETVVIVKQVTIHYQKPDSAVKAAVDQPAT